MKVAILVPVKEPESAKLRLASLLDGTERIQLARAMLEDVAGGLEALARAVPIVMVTSSPAAAKRGRELGWRTLTETRQISESASIDRASLELAREGFEAVLRLPADLPLARAEDLQGILAEAPPAPGAVLVPSRDGTGTNALLRRPPDLFPSRFGPNSRVLHLQEAARAGARVVVVESDRLGLDIDEPEDLVELLKLRAASETQRLLHAIHIEERIVRHAER